MSCARVGKYLRNSRGDGNRKTRGAVKYIDKKERDQDQTPHFTVMYLSLVLNSLLEYCNTLTSGKISVGSQVSG